jgi:Family of unknown function (DUF6502)
MASGLSVTHFQAAAQQAFVNAASTGSRLLNTRVNQSAVAAMTGLTRTQVRTLLRPPSVGVPGRVTRADHLLVGWTTDPKFATASGGGRVLSLGTGKGGFAELARKYGADIPPRALLLELKRQGLVQNDTRVVRLTARARKSQNPRNLRNLSLALSQAIRAPRGSDGKLPLKVTHAELVYPTPTPVARAILQRRVGQGLQAFLADVGTAIAAATRSSKRSGSSFNRMSKLSVLLIAQD